MNTYALAFLRDPNKGNILFIRGSHGRWSGVCGSIGQGETPEETASRKVREELGITVPEWRMVTTIIHKGDTFHVVAAEYEGLPTQTTVANEHVVHYPVISNWHREPVIQNLIAVLPLCFPKGS